jgi:hypothetical protein
MTELPYEIWRHILSFNMLPHHSLVSSMFYDIEIDLEDERTGMVLDRYSYLEDIIDKEDIQSLEWVLHNNISMPYRSKDKREDNTGLTWQEIDKTVTTTIILSIRYGYIGIALDLLMRASYSDIICIIGICIHNNDLAMLGVIIDNSIIDIYVVMSCVDKFRNLNTPLYQSISHYDITNVATMETIKEMRMAGTFIF